MATNIWDESDKIPGTETGPFSKQKLEAACKTGGEPLKYHNDYDEPSWRAFIVRKVDVDTKGNLRFMITMSEQKDAGHSEHPTECTVNINNRDEVWIALPSTLDLTVGGPQPGKEFGFLFLSPKYIAANKAAQEAGTKSKWPRGSLLPILDFARMRIIVKRLLQDVSLPNFTSDEKDILRRFAGLP